MVINKALEKEDEMELRAALENPAAMLAKVAMSSVPRYLPCLVEAKQVKVTQSGVQVRGRGKGGVVCSKLVKECVSRIVHRHNHSWTH